MYRLAASILLCAYSWAIPPAVRASQDTKHEEKEKSPAKAKDAIATMTGCVDEQDGTYVLVSDRTMTPIANLQADGFPTEGFAKHMGHKVTVRGTSTSGGALPLFKVRSIDTISETCAPQQQ